MSGRSGYGKISTSGLTFAYDMGDTETSFKGKPTTNLVPDASNMSAWSSYDNGNDGTFMTEFGTVGYKMYNRGSWNGIVKGISLPSTGTYTLSVYLRYLGGASDNNGGVIYTNGGGIGDTAQGHGKTVGEWVRFSMTRTYTTTSINFFLISYGGTYGGSYSSWEVTMPQVEAGSLMTPFVDGTRSSDNVLIDITGDNIINAANVSYSSNGEMSFDGTDDYISLPNGILQGTGDFTINQIVESASGNQGGTTFGSYPSSNLQIFYGSRFIGMYLGNASTYLGTSPWSTTLPEFTTSPTMFTAVRSGSTLKFYINGELKKTGSSTDTVGTSSTPFRIGTNTGGNERFTGNIHTTQVYNRTLSDSEINKNFLHFTKKYGMTIKDGSTSSLAAPSATHLKNLGISADGNYWLQPSGQSAFQAPVKFYLDKAMVCVMKGGNGEGFIPDSAYWENTTLLNENDFNLTSGVASKYQSYNVVPFTEFYFQMGLLDYQTTFSLSTEVSSMLTAQQRSWNDSANRSLPHYGNSLDYRTLEGRDRRYLSTLGTEIYLMGMDLKHQGHYASSGSSGGRIRVGSILDESTGNTGALTYGAAGSAFGIGVNGGNPLKTGVCGYGGWTESDIIGRNDNWSVWVVF